MSNMSSQTIPQAPLRRKQQPLTSTSSCLENFNGGMKDMPSMPMNIPTEAISILLT